MLSINFKLFFLPYPFRFYTCITFDFSIYFQAVNYTLPHVTLFSSLPALLRKKTLNIMKNRKWNSWQCLHKQRSKVSLYIQLCLLHFTKTLIVSPFSQNKSLPAFYIPHHALTPFCLLFGWVSGNVSYDWFEPMSLFNQNTWLLPLSGDHSRLKSWWMYYFEFVFNHLLISMIQKI